MSEQGPPSPRVSRDSGKEAEVQSAARLAELLGGLRAGDLDTALHEIGQRQRHLKWRRLPERVILLRHGESEGNVNRNIYTSKGDAHLELTPRGLQQAREAGARIAKIVGEDRLFVVVSPFERTQQTLLGLYQGGLDERQVDVVHACSQIREQEFGNFQSVGLHAVAQAEQAIVGRFYYRRPNAESSADVYDRVGAFWEELSTDLLLRQEKEFGTCLIVTHGLTMRLLLMKIFQWSVETLETVWNINNCHHITIRKDMDTMSYKLAPELSYPPQIPWATRPIWVVFKSRRAKPETEESLRMLKKFKESNNWGMLTKDEDKDNAKFLQREGELTGQWLEIDRAIDETENKQMLERSELFTVLDYLTVPQPRTVQREALTGRLLRGHGRIPYDVREKALKQAKEVPVIDWDDVECVDWWGSLMSYQGKMLRTQAEVAHRSLRMARHLSACGEDVMSSSTGNASG